MVRDLTTGSPIKRILGFSLPILIGNLFQQVYNMADSIIVGQYLGVDAFAAVGSTGSLSFFILGFAMGICGGLCLPIARYYGADDVKSLRRAEANGIYIALAVSVLISVAMSLLARPILRLLNTPDNIMEDAHTYISIIFAGSFTLTFFNLLAGYIRALGDSRTPLYFLVVACFVNIGLDFLFIGVFRTGVEGVAVATIISQLLSGLLCLRAIRRHFPILHFTREDAKPSLRIIGKLCVTSVPMGLQFSITAMGSIVLQSAVNGLGSGAVAAMSAGNKVQNVIIAPLEATGIAIATYTSQNLGAHQEDRIRKGTRQAMLGCAAYALLAILIARFFGLSLARIFLDPGEEVLHGMVGQFLTINSLFYIPLAVIFIYRNALQGLGHASVAMGAGLLEMVARMAVALLLVGSYGFTAVCFASPAAWVAADLFLLPMYAKVIRGLQRKSRERAAQTT